MEVNKEIQVGVNSFQADRNDSNTILYNLEISYKNGKSWLLLKRYSQFEQLNKQLREYFGEDLPNLPKKSYLTFFVGKTFDELDERRQGLDLYMKLICNRMEIYNSVILRDFLEFDKHTAQVIVEVPKMICDFKGFMHGVRDFALDTQNGILFVVVSDMNLLTRVDAYMTNMKMPWESEKGEFAMVPVGCIECWLRDETGDFVRSWTKTYNSQAISLYWDQMTLCALVGLDSGSINLLTVSEESQFKKYTESMEIEIHMDRVMGIFYDGIKNHIHSVSKDKKYRVLDMKKQTLVADYEPGDFKLTYLIVENQRKKSFVGDRCGSIYIFDISSDKPVLVIQLKTTIKFIRGLSVDNAKCFLFAVGQDEGELIVFDINKPGRENEAKEVAKLKNRSKSRELCWSGSRGEIYVGNEDGSITVWDAKKTAPIYILKAHEGDITKLVWLESDHIMISGGKDKSIKVWKMPNSWFDREKIEKDERDAEVNIKTTKIVQRGNDSDEEDLTSWHK